MSLPEYQFFRLIEDLGAFTADPDWAGEPETYTAADVIAAGAISVPLDIGNGRGACTKISLYASIHDSAGVFVDRGTMVFSLTPLEIAQPGAPGVPGIAGAEPTAIVDGTSEAGEPYSKFILDIGPGCRRVAVRVTGVASVPGSAETMRLYWKPGA